MMYFMKLTGVIDGARTHDNRNHNPKFLYRNIPYQRGFQAVLVYNFRLLGTNLGQLEQNGNNTQAG